MKKSISFFCVLFLIPLFVLSCVPAFAAEPDGQITVRARVEEVVSDEMASTSYSGGEITTRVLTLRVRVLEGAFEGQTALKSAFRPPTPPKRGTFFLSRWNWMNRICWSAMPPIMSGIFPSPYWAAAFFFF